MIYNLKKLLQTPTETTDTDGSIPQTTQEPETTLGPALLREIDAGFIDTIIFSIALDLGSRNGKKVKKV